MEQEEHGDAFRDKDSLEPAADEPGEAVPKDDSFNEPSGVVEDDWVDFSLAPKKKMHGKKARKLKWIFSLEGLADFAHPLFATESFPHLHNKSA